MATNLTKHTALNEINRAREEFEGELSAGITACDLIIQNTEGTPVSFVLRKMRNELGRAISSGFGTTEHEAAMRRFSDLSDMAIMSEPFKGDSSWVHYIARYMSDADERTLPEYGGAVTDDAMDEILSIEIAWICLRIKETAIRKKVEKVEKGE